MKARSHHIVCGIVIGIALLYSGDALAADVQIPETIRNYYRKYNFIRAFSTPRERADMFSNLRVSGSNPSSVRHSDRLKSIFEAILGLQGQLWQPHDGIEPAHRLPEDLQRPELLKVLSVNRSKDTAMVRVRAFPLNARANDRLISIFDPKSAASTIASEQQRLENAGSKTPGTELHFWFKVDNRWVLNESKIGLLR